MNTVSIAAPLLDGGETRTDSIDASDPPTIRSPSPKRHSNILGLGGSSKAMHSPAVTTTYPHLAHYIFNLLANIQLSPPHGAHPLSVSSSGESDGSDDEAEVDLRRLRIEGQDGQRTPQRKQNKSTGHAEVGTVDREALVRSIVQLLDNEQEEEVKDVLRPYMGDMGKVSMDLYTVAMLIKPRMRSSWTRFASIACIAAEVNITTLHKT
jgi:hypothetical protein